MKPGNLVNQGNNFEWFVGAVYLLFLMDWERAAANTSHLQWTGRAGKAERESVLEDMNS